MLRFQFELRAVGEVAPWGRDELKLHWFGLTEGWYWVEVGGVRLLRFAADYEIPYVDYYVVRLWEDLLAVLPAAVEEVPADLVGFVESDGSSWNETESDVADVAMSWWDSRSVYFGYLRESPSLRCWRIGDEVILDWNAAANFAEPRTLRTTVAVADFVAAIKDFDAALMAAMEARIVEVEASPPPGIALDLTQLRNEHRDRAAWLGRARSRVLATDWTAVRRGAVQLMR
ncbi:hypothetical protein GCM10029976_080260 [Kribbella albertanoniae]|uniref:Uncharacterized protein n=1 Tax=Kribbella albertanoniae TaxID=1266829 RepID=A0A4R4PS76_9ACTN|nr:hypothetical protein E1261_24840 [Kribbella albertanoniae]